MPQIPQNKMGVMPIPKLIITMSAPLMASMLFQALYNIVDSIFVAKLSQDAMNAVSLAFPFQTLLIAFSNGTGVGMNALLSKSLGAGDHDNVNRAANTGVFLYAVTALVFSLVGFCFAGPYFRMQTENAAIVKYGTDYLTICIGLCYALFAQMASERLLQATGRTNLAMIPQITGAVINMILDPIMIFGLFGFPRMEVAGAAAATLCGQFIAAIIGFSLNLRKNPELQLSLKQMRPHTQTVKTIYRIGLPSIILQSIGSVMNFCLNSILLGFTEAATAVFGAYYKIQSFIFLPVFGLNNSTVPIVSYNHGARRIDRVKESIKVSIMISVGIMTIGCILFETIPATLLSLFSPSAEMLTVGVKAFRIIGSHFPVAGFCIIAGSVCQALGRPLFSLIGSISRQLIVLLPAAYLLSLTGNLDLVWCAFPIAEVVSLIMNVVFLRLTLRGLSAELAAAEA